MLEGWETQRGARDDDEHTAWLDELLTGLESLAADIQRMVVLPGHRFQVRFSTSAFDGSPQSAPNREHRLIDPFPLTDQR